MKTLWLANMIVFAFVGMSIPAFAQVDAKASQAEAVRQFPDLAQPGSDFNNAFLAKLKAAKAAQDPSLSGNDWPMIFAEAVAKELGVQRGVKRMPRQPEGTVPLDESKSRLGETLQQCVARYGPVTKKSAVGKFPQIMFQKDGIKIGINFINEKAQQISYSKEGFFLDSDVQKLLDINSGGSVWKFSASESSRQNEPSIYRKFEVFLREDEAATAQHLVLMTGVEFVIVQSREFSKAIDADVLKGF